MKKEIQIILKINGNDYVIYSFTNLEIKLPRIGEKINVSEIVSDSNKDKLSSQDYYVIDILHIFNASVQVVKIYISTDSRNYNDFYYGLKK